MKTKFIVAVSTALFLTSPATAQPLRTSEQLAHYAQVQGWTINTVTNTSGRFVGCNAQKTESGQLLTIELYQNNNNWLVSVPTHLHGQPGWGTLSVDKTSFDGQYSYQDNVATKHLSNPEIGYMKGGRVVKIQLSGDNVRLWSLAGSLDMMHETEVCFNNGRVNELRADRAKAAQAAAPAQAAQQPSVLAGDCNTPATGRYQCSIEPKTPGQGYSDAYQVTPASVHAPAYFFQGNSQEVMDAWIATSDGQWKFIGAWEKIGNSDCVTPSPNQSAEVWTNLGQDAWQLCVYLN